MKTSFRVVAGMIACLSIVGANAQTLDKIKKEGAITLGYRDSAAPFSYLDDK